MQCRTFLVVLGFTFAAGCGSSASTATPTDAATDTAADATADAATDAANSGDAACPAKPTVCCCLGDTVAPAQCQAGTWICGSGYVSYQSADCAVLPAGKCGLPDVVNSDTAQPDATPADSAQPDASQPDATPQDTAPAEDVASADSAEVEPGNPCTATGGSVGEGLCCQTAGDFPNSCAVGACGCAPNYSHKVLVCNCPAGKCFEPGVGCKGM
ncbi:MAG: hypothetical protein HY902_09540 [Deltaproteobacteria bacterium]|nr:hypothetical protein [Deltaproteobacteria bacterium]